MVKELIKIYYIMAKDVKTYYFKPPNLIMGLMFPAVMIFTFSMRGIRDIMQFLPGLIAMTTFFGASSMETVIIALGRRDKSLERLLMAPLAFRTMLSGKILGGMAFGLVTTLILLPLGVGVFSLPIQRPLLLAVSILVSAFSFSSFGAFIGVYPRESWNAMSLGNLTRFPMVFLSGVFLPVHRMPFILTKIAYFLPLTYSVDLMRSSTINQENILSWHYGLIILVLFGIFFLWISTKLIKRWLI